MSGEQSAWVLVEDATYGDSTQTRIVAAFTDEHQAERARHALQIRALEARLGHVYEFRVVRCQFDPDTSWSSPFVVGQFVARGRDTGGSG